MFYLTISFWTLEYSSSINHRGICSYIVSRVLGRKRSYVKASEPFTLETHTVQFSEGLVSHELDLSSKFYQSINGLVLSSSTEAYIWSLHSYEGSVASGGTAGHCVRVVLIQSGIQSTYMSYIDTPAEHLLGFQGWKVGIQTLTRTVKIASLGKGEERSSESRPERGIHRGNEDRPLA